MHDKASVILCIESTHHPVRLFVNFFKTGFIITYFFLNVKYKSLENFARGDSETWNTLDLLQMSI